MSDLVQGASRSENDSSAPNHRNSKFESTQFLKDALSVPSLQPALKTLESPSITPGLPPLQIDLGSPKTGGFAFRKNPWSFDADPASSRNPFLSPKPETGSHNIELPSWIRNGSIKKEKREEQKTEAEKQTGDKLPKPVTEKKEPDATGKQPSEAKPQEEKKQGEILPANIRPELKKTDQATPLLPFLEIHGSEKPTSKDKTPEFSLPQAPKLADVTRSIDDLKRFYKAQDDGVSCSAFSMAMLYSDQFSGSPVEYGKAAQSFKQLAGTIGRGYRGDLQSMADKLQSLGLNAKAFSYKTVDEQTLKDLDKELGAGHSAVGHVKNPHTGNGHYIFIAGKTEDGKYIIGDPDKANTSHFQPVTAKALLKMLAPKDGFVSGWSNDNSSVPAANIKGTAAYRRLHRK